MAGGNPFRGLTANELLAIRAQALADITAGKVVVSSGSGGKSFGKQVSMSADDRLRYALDELRRLDPTTYGTKVTQAVAQFS
jgi:hypothetical protein